MSENGELSLPPEPSSSSPSTITSIPGSSQTSSPPCATLSSTHSSPNGSRKLTGRKRDRVLQQKPLPSKVLRMRVSADGLGIFAPGTVVELVGRNRLQHPYTGRPLPVFLCFVAVRCHNSLERALSVSGPVGRNRFPCSPTTHEREQGSTAVGRARMARVRTGPAGGRDGDESPPNQAAGSGPRRSYNLTRSTPSSSRSMVST